MADYESLYGDFRWEFPEHFNFGDVIGRYAADPRRVAILWEDQQGRRSRLTFADIRAQSNRIANVLAGSGIARGDPVMLVLPRVTLWQAAYIGALKAGALVIPCASMLREKDLVYRANHSGARAIIASHDSATMISDLKNQCPTLKQFFIAGSSRSGW
ncbi:MAG: AMP-binding protein, partial [Candidatus Binataceae bacterium]